MMSLGFLSTLTLNRLSPMLAIRTRQQHSSNIQLNQRSQLQLLPMFVLAIYLVVVERLAKQEITGNPRSNTMNGKCTKINVLLGIVLYWIQLRVLQA